MSQELQQPEAGSELAPTSQRFHGDPTECRRLEASFFFQPKPTPGVC